MLSCLAGAAMLLSPAAIMLLSPSKAATPNKGEQRFDGARALLQGYVDGGQLPCAAFAVIEDGAVVCEDTYGWQDAAKGIPLGLDSIFRMYSMTKAVTSVAAMILVEKGIVKLDEPIGSYLSEFRDLPTVFKEMKGEEMVTEPATRHITLRDLLTHSSGLTYGFFGDSPVDHAYRAAGISTAQAAFDMPLPRLAEKLASLPLCFQPGTGWQYGFSTDVVGYLVQVVANMPFNDFVAEHILAPLGMADTDFCVPESKLHRFCENYVFSPGFGHVHVPSPLFAGIPPPQLSGGGGLCSTLRDYLRFMRMLLNEGELDGVRIIKPETAHEMMGRNHLQGGKDLSEMAFSNAAFSESALKGVGFCLMGSYLIDPESHLGGRFCRVGEVGWGGMASTYFFLDVARRRGGILLTQLIPSSALPVRPQFRALVHKALDGGATSHSG